MACNKIDLAAYNGYAVNMGYLYTGTTATFKQDISARVFHLKVKEKKDSAGFLLELTNATGTDSGLHILDTFSVEIRINSADSDGLTTAGKKPYEWYYVESGEKVMVAEGDIEFVNGMLE